MLMLMQDRVCLCWQKMYGCLSSTQSMFRMVLPRSGECVVPEGLMGGQR
jgi:hypothetical protein